MKKIIKNHISTILFMLLIIIITFFIYIKYYYNEIKMVYILNHFIVCSNIIINTLGYLYYRIIDCILTTDNFKFIVLAFIIIYIIKSVDLEKLESFLKSIKNFQSPWFSFERQIEIMKEVAIYEKENIENLEGKVSSGNSACDEFEKQIDISREKMRLIQIIISDPYLLQILNNFINKKKYKKRIPINVFKTYNTDNFKEIFEITYESGQVVLDGIKSEIKDVINDIYIDISTRY